MSYDFSSRRWLIFGICLLIWIGLGGFSNFGFPSLIQIDPARIHRVWVRFTTLFVFGAVMASFVDHYVGHMPPSNLRPLYIIIGGLLMLLASILLVSLRVKAGA